MGTRERREREARQRREEILEAARHVFWTKGYLAATMPQIASRAEIASGTLYLYFPSKDVLYVELLIEGYTLLRSALEQAQRDDVEAEHQTSLLIDAFFGFAERYPEYFDIIFFVLQREKGKWDTTFPSGVVERLEAAEASCQDVVAEALARVTGRSRDGRQALLNAVWSMLAGVVFYFRAKPDFDSTAHAARELILKAVRDEL